MEKMIFTAEENSFIVEADGKKLRVSYEEFSGNHADAMKFCKEHNGGDGTSQNSQLNPLFVAEMMGFPTDWTLLPFLRGAENPSKPTATP